MICEIIITSFAAPVFCMKHTLRNLKHSMVVFQSMHEAFTFLHSSLISLSFAYSKQRTLERGIPALKSGLEEDLCFKTIQSFSLLQNYSIR